MSKVLWSSVVGVSVCVTACVTTVAQQPEEGPYGGAGGQVNGSGGQVNSGGMSSGGTPSGGVPGAGGSSAGQVSSGGAAGSNPGSGGTPTGGAGGTVTAGTGGDVSAGTGGQAPGPWGNTKCADWPAANGSENVSSTIEVNGSYDGEMRRFVGTGSLSEVEGEGLPPIFELSNGETLSNVIIGAPASDGIHCTGSCTLENVWWEDVGEDAASLLGSGTPTMTIDCGGARGAVDKVFQHNAGGTMIIRNFTLENVDKVYRSCGNCDSQPTRHVQLENVTAKTVGRIVGLNQNYGDTATFTNILTLLNKPICERYDGCEGCDEPTFVSAGPDPEHCLYEYSDIHY